MSPISEARRKANEKYNAKAYETVLIRVKKGQKDLIKYHAAKVGESINGYIVKAVQERMDQENHS